jgi:hypothetical protein
VKYRGEDEALKGLNRKGVVIYNERPANRAGKFKRESFAERLGHTDNYRGVN